MRRHDADQLVGIHELGIADGKFHAVVSPARDLGDIGFEITFKGHRLKLGGLSRKNNGKFHSLPSRLQHRILADGR